MYTARTDQPSNNGWLKDERVKILGVARLRQQRVRKDSCETKTLLSTQVSCLPQLGQATEDKTNYDPSWKLQSKIHSKEKYWRILQPWQYQNAFQSQSISQFGKIMLYSGGGYIVNLGRTMANSLTVIKFIKKHNWIDRQTRVVFIEFTTYGNCYNLIYIYFLIIHIFFRCRFKHIQCYNVDS